MLAYWKTYLPVLSAQMADSLTDPETLISTKKGSSEMIWFIMNMLEECNIYAGKSLNVNGGLVFSYQKKDDSHPTFLYFAHSLQQSEKLPN